MKMCEARLRDFVAVETTNVMQELEQWVSLRVKSEKNEKSYGSISKGMKTLSDVLANLEFCKSNLYRCIVRRDHCWRAYSDCGCCYSC